MLVFLAGMLAGLCLVVAGILLVYAAIIDGVGE